MRTGYLKILAITALMGCFLLPMDGSPFSSRLFQEAESLYHFAAYALCYALLISLLRSFPVIGPILAGGGLLFTLGVVELIQPFVGREDEWADIIYGMGGMGFGFCLVMVGCTRRGTRLKWMAASLLLALGAAVPFLLTLWDQYRIRVDYPVLASFESPLEMGRWTAQGSHIQRTREHVSQGEIALQVVPDEGRDYPGVFMNDFLRDWRRVQALCFDVYLQGDNPAVLWLRVDDNKDPVEYGDRFQKPMELTPGWNSLCVKKREWGTTSNGRSMNLAHIETWGLFLDRGSQDRVFYLDSVSVIAE